MLNDDLTAVLHADADAAGLPPADLLFLVRRRAARDQRRKAAALGLSAVVVAGVAVTGALTLHGSQHTTVLKAAGSPPSAVPSAPAADPLCATPTGTPPPRYIDWPCATPADATTSSIVAKLVASVRAGHPGITDPQVRLLADSRGITDSYYGPSATLIEEWDGAGGGPAVLAYGSGTVADPLGNGDQSGYADAGDPAMLNGSLSTDNGVQDVLLFARADIASVSLDHGGPVTSEPFSGGASAVSVKAGDISVQHPSWNYVGKGASGGAVISISYDSIFLATGNGDDPCAGSTLGTCSSRGSGLTPIPGGAPVEAPTARATGSTVVPSPVPVCGSTETLSPVPASAKPAATEVPSPVPVCGSTEAPSAIPASAVPASTAAPSAVPASAVPAPTEAPSASPTP